MKTRQGLFTRLHDERGVTTVVVVASLIGILSAVVLSLGFGSAWANRRVIITATDATALHEARIAALTGAACDPLAGVDSYSNFLRRNANDITFEDCVLHPDSANPGTGYVVVEARKLANAPFGGIFGIGDTQPYSLSAAEYGFARPEGLRPMAFCLDNAHVMQWIWYQNWKRIQAGQGADPQFGTNAVLTDVQYNGLKGDLDAGRPPLKGVDYNTPANSGDSVLFQLPLDLRIDYPLGSAATGAGGTSYADASIGTVHRMFFTKDTVYEGGNCGSSTGNWGWISLDDGQPSTDKQNEWTENGYNGTMSAGDCNNDGSPDACSGDTGSSGGAGQQELQQLIDDQTQFYIPIFTNVSGGSGSNGEFTIWGFLPLILRGFKVTGAESDRYFDFEFKDVITSGPCCAKTGGLGTPKGIRICGVDHDGATTDAIIDERCGQGTSSP